MTRTTTPIASTKTPKPVASDSDKLLAVMIANLARAKEPLLITRLKEAVERIQAARRRCP
jgi:DNA-binding MurR/RpiR family transcriptional regulator